MRLPLGFLLAFAVMVPLGALRAQAPLRLEAGVTMGTLGVGPEISLGYGDVPLALRLNMTALNLSLNGRVRGTEYKGAFNATGGGALLDYFPFQTGLRLTGGARFGAPRWKLRATPAADGSIKIGSNTYDAADVGTVSGRDRFNAVLPYAGFGYSTSFFNDRLVVSSDVGVAYQGSGHLSLGASGPISNDATFRSDLASETRKLRHYANVPVYPVVMLSLRYNFFSMAAHEPMAVVNASAAGGGGSAPASVPAAAPTAPLVRTYVVYFGFDSAALNARARDVVAEAANSIRTTGLTRIEVSGHTDASGTPAYNMRLSARRAEAVASQLARHGVARDQMAIVNLGESQPAVATVNGQRQPQNRRVEVVAR
jgi:outer membrane protein OmpA-like peptidoglycan-associated protein